MKIKLKKNGLEGDNLVFIENLEKSINEGLEDLNSGLSEKEVNAIVDKFDISKTDSYSAIKNELEKATKALEVQGLELKSLKEAGKGNKNPFCKTIKDFLTSDDFKNGKNTKSRLEITMKAADVITSANATNAPHALSYEVVPGVQEAARQQNVIFPELLKGSTTSQSIKWINRVNEDGGAAVVAEGTLKPLKDWDYSEENSTAKKIAVASKVSSEMYNDFPYMESEINKLLMRDIYDEVDKTILNGVGATDFHGIIEKASGYVSTNLDGTVINPNNADAIRAAMLQMRLLNYVPNVVFLNPADVAALDLIKTTDGHYIKVETDSIMQRIRIIETNEIQAGKFLIMDTFYWNVRVLEDLRLEVGWENDDFRKNLILIIAEIRVHSYQNSIDAGSAVYEDFATVKTALEVTTA